MAERPELIGDEWPPERPPAGRTAPTERGRRIAAQIRAELAATPDPWRRYRGADW